MVNQKPIRSRKNMTLPTALADDASVVHNSGIGLLNRCRNDAKLLDCRKRLLRTSTILGFV